MQEPGDWHPTPFNVNLNKLEDANVQALEVQFPKNENFKAITYLGRDKAPGPNSFTIDFWIFNLDTIKTDVIDFFKNFTPFGRFPKVLNATFPVLIPKREGIIISRAQTYKFGGKLI